jgi:hypothetical protein
MAIDLYTPKTLYGVLSKMPPVRTFLRDTFFTETVEFPTETVEFDVYKGGREMAPFVHPRQGSVVRPNSGYQTKSYKTPLISESRVTTAADLMTRAMGENPYSGRTPAARALQKLSQDLQALELSITRREEWMAAQVLFTGKVPVVGKGVNEIIDFGFTNSEEITAAADKWSNPSASILDQLEDWYTDVQRDGYVNPDMLIVGKAVAQDIVRNEQLKELLDIQHYELATIAPRQLPGGVIWIGRIQKLNLDIYQYNEWYLDDWTDPENPETKPLVPEDTVALMSTSARFAKLYGLHTYMDETTKTWKSVVGTRIPDSWVRKDPDRQMLSLSSHPLLVPHEVDSWYVAKVR